MIWAHLVGQKKLLGKRASLSTHSDSNLCALFLRRFNSGERVPRWISIRQSILSDQNLACSEPGRELLVKLRSFSTLKSVKEKTNKMNIKFTETQAYQRLLESISTIPYKFNFENYENVPGLTQV